MDDQGEAAAACPPFVVRLSFHGDLGIFLKQSARAQPVERPLKERTSIKDIIESCGVPHPEVDVIRCGNEELNFSCVIDKNMAIEIYPVDFTHVEPPPVHLQTREVSRFVADVHLGGLTHNLRLLGIDVAARDRRLLMHSIVQTGFHPRSQVPDEQTMEVLRRFNLASHCAPFTRCLHCNALLQTVAKAEVSDRLEPLTRKYYDEFRRCPGCDRIYWRGSHFDKLLRRVEEFRSKIAVR